MANYAELYIDIGSDFNQTVYVTDDGTGNLIDLTGYVLSSNMKSSYYSQNVKASFVVTIPDAANGNVSLYMAANATTLLVPGRYVFDIKATNQGLGNTTTRVVDGIVIAEPGVT